MIAQPEVFPRSFMLYYRTQAEYDDLHQAMYSNEIYRTWLRWTDDGTSLNGQLVYILFSGSSGSEGEFHDMRTLEPVDFMSIPWRVETEPTGYLVENCTGEQCLIAAYALVSMLNMSFRNVE